MTDQELLKKNHPSQKDQQLRSLLNKRRSRKH